MAKLPLALSVPHSGISVPEEVDGICILTRQQVIEDGDVGAEEIYTPLADHVTAFEKSVIARAIVDLNRARDDFRKDGIIKTHTCWDIPVYKTCPDDVTIEKLVHKYYQPYHDTLTEFSNRKDILAGIDCHTMATHGPPVGPDPGKPRPFICLGNANHTTCPQSWIETLAEILQQEFLLPVAINRPFSGGYITRHYGRGRPWIQLELSRTDIPSMQDKTEGILRSLKHWCKGEFN